MTYDGASDLAGHTETTARWQGKRIKNWLRQWVCRLLGFSDPSTWTPTEQRLIALHAASLHALDVKAEQKVGEVPESLRQLDAALMPYLDQRREIVAMLPDDDPVRWWGRDTGAVTAPALRVVCGQADEDGREAELHLQMWLYDLGGEG